MKKEIREQLEEILQDCKDFQETNFVQQIQESNSQRSGY